MQLRLSEEQELLRSSLERLLADVSSIERVRRSEAQGFDPELWREMAQFGAWTCRADEADGGGMGLLDACLIAQEAGRHLASVPFAEGMVVSRLLSLAGGAGAVWLAAHASGEKIVTLALNPLEGASALVPGGAAADAVICLSGDKLYLVDDISRRGERLSNWGGFAHAQWRLNGIGRATCLAQGDKARELHGAAVEEWKLLTSAALTGLGRKALEIGAAYARERTAFGQAIGSFQGLAHPFADCAADIEGSALLWRYAIARIAERKRDAGALIPMAYWWAARSAVEACLQSLQCHGGYGLTLEYDIQLYLRRAKCMPLALGDPENELICAGLRLWRDEPAYLPDAGECGLDFGLGPEAESMRRRAREFFATNLVGEFKSHAHFSWEGHHPEFQKKLADAGLLFPSWPREHGGEEIGPYAARALRSVFQENDWTAYGVSVTNIVGQSVMRFGSDALKKEVLPKFTRGEAICCLGYTEPHAGSDVFAAKVRAVRDGNEWAVNGQKMFTSGANLAQYVFLLARTDPGAPKHAGLTLFLIPMTTKGIEVHPVHTISDERTNITYYENVRVPDMYRVGEINGAVKVMALALSIEQSGSQSDSIFQMVDHAVAWARSAPRGGGVALDDPGIVRRIGEAAVRGYVSEVLALQSLWCHAESENNRWIGPMSKLFSSEAFKLSGKSLMDMAAPDSMMLDDSDASRINHGFRHGIASGIYGGTSQIMRSLIAETALGLPKTRS